nr:hypothetical protein GCM10020093_054640 [Planobispora longispora]
MGLGVAIGLSPRLRAAAEPVLEFFRAIPPPVLVPLIMVLAGIDDGMKVLVIASGCVWPILLNTVEGVRALDEVLSDTCRMYGVRGPSRLRHLVLRGASPQIMAGLRQALSIGIILMVISEMFASSSGLGFTIVLFQRGFEIPEMWSGILLLGLLGYTLALLFRRLERRVLSWHRGRGWTVLEVCGVRKVYEDRGVEALREVTFEVDAGELVCVVGPSGCGKTTLLRCVAGLLPPTAGSVRVGGVPVTGPPPRMAVVFQEYGRSLFPWMTVRQNVELPLKEKKVPAGRRNELVAGALAAVGLADVADAHPWQLSGGMQQRVAIARAVAYEPQVLLMDEPFAAVDAQTRADLEDLILALWRDLGVTTLFVTHDIDEAVYLGQRVIVLSGSPTVVMEDLKIDLPPERDQLTTRSLPRFADLRGRLYAQIQRARGTDEDGEPMRTGDR